MRLTLAAAVIGFAFSAPAFGDSATITQNGVDNYAAIEQQNADASTALIYQLGNRNQAGSAASGEIAATQGIRQVNATASRADIYQRGDDNNAMVDQQDVTNVFWSRIVQGEAYASNRNAASIQQSSLTSAFAEIFQDRANDNSAAISQTGTSQSGQIVQGAWRWSPGWAFTGTPANNNNATISQSGERQSSLINQLGDWNRAATVQTGSWNDAFIQQEGSFNSATITQFGTGATAGDRNIARITQSGSGHNATTNQSGLGNTALINQH